MKKPFITVITVTYNCKNEIEKTLQSVLGLEGIDLEYIVIDGASTDGTVDIIRRYADRLAYWVSEPDHGIYEAMNKGLMKATGDWINFMNAGDVFSSPTVVREMFEHDPSDQVLCLYADYRCLKKEGASIVPASPLSRIRTVMPFCHQTAFVRNDRQRRFRTDLRLCSDHDFFLNIYEHCGASAFLYRQGLVVCDFSPYGATYSYQKLLRDERIKVIYTYNKPRGIFEWVRFRLAILSGHYKK